MSDPLKLSASLWSADLSALAHSIERVNEYCDSYHFDIMDGHYVKSLLFGVDTVASLRDKTDRPFEVHLMVRNPKDFVNDFVGAGANLIQFQFDGVDNPASHIEQIKSLDANAGICVLEETPIEKVFDLLPLVDNLLVMGTKIGVKGVSIIPETYEKIRLARKYIDENDLNVSIQADGGIRRNTVPELFRAGVNSVTAGSLLFRNDPKEIKQWVNSLSGELRNEN
ncbi:ribulose-phosphate 3-epimerase [Gilvimarinus sp. SDUM040013]|uniref:Ribulose-phosphate 3-epimerase n=1 Tax=Gilvimarinus gilvus TaxID=3058038 RepID=A0ABU4S697_9GAMM|nr:ribulose-phosphate 3-epimerase [Gilvimarinus sp. SDUM040013]MDO3387176.1 ribulose-phosphate 3-epimerase [Gilvimarinus sp. SDUM040013]MDX6851433.1 ribulose-phosphate 3-epimerase [Gilvimarinus sp. SDUM040013]